MRDPKSLSLTENVIVYCGPSISPTEVQQLLPGCVIAPPVARGALYRSRRDGFRLQVIIDGTFSHGFAVSPREVVDVLGDGGILLGAASMGAVRAAECWPAGMHGIGIVYRLFRHAIISSDDEVAVMTDPERDYAAMTVALVSVRYALRRATIAGLMHQPDAETILTACKRMHFKERTWPHILRQAKLDSRLTDESVAFLRKTEVKREDARRALRYTASLVKQNSATTWRRESSLTERPPRYVGHDRYFGRTRKELRRDLFRWLIGSGRYQRYLWAVVAGEPEFAWTPGTDAESQALRLRELLPNVLTRLLSDEDTLGERFWAELTVLDELDAELMHFHAFKELAMQSAPPSGPLLQRVREEVAISHGYPSWGSLLDCCDDNHILGHIPLAWVDDACMTMASVRFGMGRSGSVRPQ